MPQLFHRTMPLLLATTLILLSSGTDAASSRGRFNSFPKQDDSNDGGRVGGNLRASATGAAEHTKTTAPPLEFVYPDVTLRGCRTNTFLDNEPIQKWMDQNVDNGYLFFDLASCCTIRFAGEVDTCLEVGKKANNLVGSSVVGKPSKFIGTTTSNNVRLKSSALVLQQRRLGKSDKSGKQSKYSKPHSWQKPPQQPWQKPPKQNNKPAPHQKPHQPAPGWNQGQGGTKTAKAKSAKSKSAKAWQQQPSWPVPPQARTKDPTRKPTPRPTPKPSPTPIIAPPTPSVGDKSLEVTMGGLLTATNLSVPPSNSQEMKTLAYVFEQTILRALEEGYDCDVYSIGGIPTGDAGSYVEQGPVNQIVFTRNRYLQGSSSLEGDVVPRDLQSSLAGVLFDLRIVKPCNGCTDEEATFLAAKVFDETFDALEEKQTSGELTLIFCGLAQVAQIVATPCEVEIRGVEYTSLAYEYVDIDAPTTPAPATSKPVGTPAPVMPKVPATPKPTQPEVPPTPKPTQPVTDMPVSIKPTPTKAPVMEWPPTPYPTVKPVADTSSPTMKPVDVPAGTNPPTAKPVDGEVVTNSPVTVPMTLSPVLTKPVTQAPMMAGTTSPNMVPATLSPVIADVTTTAPVMGSALPTVSPNSMVPATSSPIPTMKPVGVSALPTVSPNMMSKTPTPTLKPVEMSSAPTDSPSKAPVPVSSAPTANPSMKPVTLAPTSNPTSDALIVSSAPSPASSNDTLASSSPTPFSEGSTTIAPTSIPPGAIYYTSFESGTFPIENWSTSGDGLWDITSERAATGIYSIRSPDLANEELATQTSNVTFTTPSDWPAGALVLSILAGVNMPYDNLVYYVDDEYRGQFMDQTSFKVQQIPLGGPGMHVVTFSYVYNPVKLDAFPPPEDGRIGIVFLDDVYFLPEGVTVAPTASLPNVTSTSPTLSLMPTVAKGSVAPTPVQAPSIPSSIAPTTFPPGALYYDGFEQGTFPGDPEWSTTGDNGLWELTQDRVNSGVYSVKSPELASEELTRSTSNVTITTMPTWPSGKLYYSILAGVNMPFDDLVYFVDGAQRGQYTEDTDFEQHSIVLSPGQHEVTFSYRFNPVPVDQFPPPEGVRIGAVYLDDVYFLPDGVTLAPSSSVTGSPVSGGVTLAPSPSVSVPEIPTESTGSTASPVSQVAPTSVQPTIAKVPSTISPTSLPPGALYYDGFEQGTFPEDSEWTTQGDDVWALSTARTNSGVYSIQSPDLMSDNLIPGNITQKVSNVTLTTPQSWPSGFLHFSILGGTNLPFDGLRYYLDGEYRGEVMEKTEFEERKLQLPPGEHNITFSYIFNPVELDGIESVFPPIPVDRIGAVFIDDVYFLPDGAGELLPSSSPVVSTGGGPVTSSPNTEPTVEPTSPYPSYNPTFNPIGVSDGATSPTISPAVSGNIPAQTASPSIATVPSTIAPTSIPPESVYFNGFERGTFPDDDPEWTTNVVDNGWSLTTDRAHSGVYSIKSANLAIADGFIPANSSVTFTYGDEDFEGGTLLVSILASVELPMDEIIYFLNGEQAGQMVSQNEWETLAIILPEGGPHDVTFQYRYNPYRLDALPPAQDPEYVGAVFLDDVHVMPFSDVFFDGFESGDFDGLDWKFEGQEAWMVDGTNPFEGAFSAHVRTEDISASGEYAQLDLDVTMASAAFIQFFFYAPVAMPFEIFSLYVDGQSLTPLSTMDETWTEAGAILSAGEHTISWRLSKNPGGAPDDVLDELPSPDYRVGEAWLDNVQLLPATPSFEEDWESGDFSANPWVLSGDAEWAITDEVAFEGSNSATISSAAIEGVSGTSELSIDIITEQGGKLEFQIWPSVAGPFEIVTVLIDELAITTFSTPLEDWLSQEISIQPGKRRVTFQMNKNPGNIPDDTISNIPNPPGRDGQVWLDGIVFTETQTPS